MKFKVGDKVKIIKDKSFLRGYVGTVGTIIGYSKRHFTKDDAYDIDFDNSTASLYMWVDDELELVEHAPFTKSDLKDGMVVEYRNGSREMVFGSRTIDKAGWHNLDEYSESLTEEKYHFAHHAIDKVYKVNNNTVYNFNDVFKDEYLELIWERKEEPKPTHKYKVGDKVKVRSDLKHLAKYGGVGVLKQMCDLRGKTVTIKNAVTTGSGLNVYDIDESYWYWTDEMFEGLVDYEEMTVAEIEEKLGYKIKIIGED